MNIVDQRYVQPMAQHVAHPERLLLRDQRDQWFLWAGQLDEEVVAIEPELAAYILNRPEIAPLPLPRMWFATDDLPLEPTAFSGILN